VWHGSSDEAAALTLAIVHNCACDGKTCCGAHLALFDQRWLDSILFFRWMRERLEWEEGLLCPDM
jgi:hypothetical protein